MSKGDWQEELTLVSHSKRQGYLGGAQEKGSLQLRLRVRAIWGVFFVGFAMILAKTLYIQAIEGGQYKLLSQANHVELIRETAMRGEIRDRSGRALVENERTENKILRKYPLGEAIAPVLGYISEVTEEELGCYDGLCYQQGMYIGRSGMEKSLEAELRGQDGGRLIEVDSSGREVRELGKNLAEPGRTIELTLDARLQEIMYQAISGRKGSGVAIDMQGKVMGLVSSPSYSALNLTNYLGDKVQLYFLNRAVSGSYPPGSVFKLVTAHAGLAEGKIDEETSYEDTGEIKVGIYRYGNWYFDQYGKTEGQVDLIKALSRSNDIYFYKVGEEVGVSALTKWARRFGLGEVTGIELPGEVEGTVPDQLSKERATGEKWFLGNTYHLSIGQGDLLVTPAQVARMTLAAISGRKCELSLLKNKDPKCADLGLKTEDLALVATGMKAACASGGTAFSFFRFEPAVLCKTGTAQHGGQKTEEDLPHAWITVAYPGENPEIILTVMLESSGEGSAEAGPVATEILSKWRDLGKGENGTLN